MAMCSTARPAASRSPTSRVTATWSSASKRPSRASSTARRSPSSCLPADGYGQRDEALIQRVPRRTLQGAGEIKKGMQFQARTDGGMRLFTVTAVVGDMVTLDGNHPLADQTLHFDVEIVGVREATAEELEHGHVHGAGGHHH